jgi:hypothetical protein
MSEGKKCVSRAEPAAMITPPVRSRAVYLARFLVWKNPSTVRKKKMGADSLPK